MSIKKSTKAFVLLSILLVVIEILFVRHRESIFQFLAFNEHEFEKINIYDGFVVMIWGVLFLGFLMYSLFKRHPRKNFHVMMAIGVVMVMTFGFCFLFVPLFDPRPPMPPLLE